MCVTAPSTGISISIQTRDRYDVCTKACKMYLNNFLLRRKSLCIHFLIKYELRIDFPVTVLFFLCRVCVELLLRCTKVIQ